MKTIVRRVYLLDGGALDVESSAIVPGRDYGTRIQIPVQMFLVDTSRGFILIDTGNDPDVMENAEGVWGRALATAARPVMEPRNHPLEQLGLLGLTESDIRMVIYTHLHHDHCGGGRFFPDAVHVVQKAEYRWASRPDQFASLTYVPSDFQHEQLSWKLMEGDLCILPGIHLISTPGHTPGHQSIALWDVPECGSLIIAGDAINCESSITDDLPPGFTSDASAAASSMHRLTALASVAQASLIVSHDMGFFDSLPKAPEPLRNMAARTRELCEAGLSSIYGDSLDPAQLM